MITTKVESIVVAVPVFKQLLEKNFPAADSFKIARLVRELNKELEIFEHERLRLLEGCGDLIDGKYKVRLEMIDYFNKEIDALLGVTIELKSDKLSTDIFKDVTMTPQQSLNILDFVE